MEQKTSIISNGTENFNNPILNFAWNNNFKLPLGISLDVDLVDDGFSRLL